MGEALNSWVARLGSRLGLNPADAAQCAFGIDSVNRPDWWRRPEMAELAAIANRTGLAIERIQAMTLSGWAQERADERHERFEAAGFRRQQTRAATLRPTPICGLCLGEDAVPFLRLEWTIGWVAICPHHRTTLITHCPVCGARLTQPSLGTRRKVALGRCQRCSVEINGSAGTPAHDSACALQARLMKLKRAGSESMSGLGAMTWPLMIGLIDLVLTAVWSTHARHARERLFDRILADGGFARDERFGMDWSSNYGAMLILAWLFDAWPHRMTQAMDILRAPGLTGLAASVATIGNELPRQVIAMLADIVPDRPPVEDEWRKWLADLPFTAEMLREREKCELRQDASRRLQWFADLRAGMDVTAAAERARISPLTIERWLEAGIEYGLDAILAEQTRINFLPADQRHAITVWLETVPRFCKGPNAWSIEHAQHEIATLFGVRLSFAGVQSLYNHRPRRR